MKNRLFTNMDLCFDFLRVGMSVTDVEGPVTGLEIVLMTGTMVTEDLAEDQDHLGKEGNSVQKIVFCLIEKQIIERRHEKTCLCHMRTTKVQISLHIRTV